MCKEKIWSNFNLWETQVEGIKYWENNEKAAIKPSLENVGYHFPFP